MVAATERWVDSINELHRSKPPPQVHYTKTMPDNTIVGCHCNGKRQDCSVTESKRGGSSTREFQTTNQDLVITGVCIKNNNESVQNKIKGTSGVELKLRMDINVVEASSARALFNFVFERKAAPNL